MHEIFNVTGMFCLRCRFLVLYEHVSFILSKNYIGFESVIEISVVIVVLSFTINKLSPFIFGCVSSKFSLEDLCVCARV